MQTGLKLDPHNAHSMHFNVNWSRSHCKNQILNFSLQASRVVECQVALLLLWTYLWLGRKDTALQELRERQFQLISPDSFVSSVVHPAIIAHDACAWDHVILPIHFKPDSNHLAKWIEIKPVWNQFGSIHFQCKHVQCALIRIECILKVQCEQALAIEMHNTWVCASVQSEVGL